MPPRRRGPAEPGDSEEAVPSRLWPGEQPLPPELLADSRGAAYTAACALQESSRETEALCAPWPVPWAALVEAQGQDGSAAALEQELDAALVGAAQCTATGGVPPSQIEAVRARQTEHCQVSLLPDFLPAATKACVDELRARILTWLQHQPRLSGAGDNELALRGERGVALVLKTLGASTLSHGWLNACV